MTRAAVEWVRTTFVSLSRLAGKAALMHLVNGHKG